MEIENKKAADILIKAGLDKIPWGIRVIEAEMRGSSTVQDGDDASSWWTCACSYYKEVPRGKRDSQAAPNDDTLFRVGMEFVEHVTENDFELAAWALCIIDARAKVVISLEEIKRLYPILGLAQSQ
jgi:hypothetical protein